MEREFYDIRDNQLTHGRGYVYCLQYHIVWCTKYRRPVLKDGADTDCKVLLQELAKEYKFRIMAMEVMPDHIHLLIDALVVGAGNAGILGCHAHRATPCIGSLGGTLA